MLSPIVSELVRAGNVLVARELPSGGSRRSPLATRPTEPVVRPARKPPASCEGLR
jgi:hypothetical protein